MALIGILRNAVGYESMLIRMDTKSGDSDKLQTHPAGLIHFSISRDSN
jgi:hypothetical protein